MTNLPPLPPLGFGQALGESDEALKARVKESLGLPPLPALTPQIPPSSDWAIDDADPVLGDCKPCKGRGRFVNIEWSAIKLECEMCKGTGK